MGLAGLVHVLVLAGLAGQEDPAQDARLAAELGALAQGAELESVAERLRAPGPAAAPALLAALGRSELALAPGTTLALGAREQEALARAARGLGREAFQAHWGAAAAGSDPDLRLGVIRLVGLVGRSGDLRLAVEAARPPLAASPDARVGDALEAAVAGLLARDRGTLPLLRPALLSLPPELADRLVRAVAAHDDRRSLAFLVDCLPLETRLELPLLCGIARAARSHGPPFEDALGARVRPYLRHAERQTVRAALEAAGHLQDPLALELLLEHAASPEPGLSAAAFQALRQVTLQSLPARVERWQAWYAAERRWEEERGPRLREALRSEDPRALATALRELATHPLRRAQLAPLVAGLLQHPDESVRLAACGVARAFGPELARGLLTPVVDDDSPAVASLARASLAGAR